MIYLMKSLRKSIPPIVKYNYYQKRLYYHEPQPPEDNDYRFYFSLIICGVVYYRYKGTNPPTVH